MILKQKKWYMPLAILGILVIFISSNIIFSFTTESIVADMTADKRFSLSDYSREQIKKIIQPIYVTIYYSSEIANENPVYGRYAEYVFKFLKQYQNLSSGKINIAIKDPVPYSTEEKEAKSHKIIAFPSEKGNTNLYFGAVFSDGDKKKYTIANISQKRDFWLEKDITFALTNVVESQKETIGIISPVHKIIARNYGQKTDVYAVIDELSEKYAIAEFPENIKEIPADVKVLILVVPRNMPPSLKYALDQYVLRGGKLILYLDMIVEKPYYISKKETLDKVNDLLKNWGVEISEKGVGSFTYGQEIYLKTSRNEIQKMPYPLWLNLTGDTLNSETKITNNLSHIKMNNALEIKEVEHDENVKVTPLIKIPDGGTYTREQLLSGKQYIVSNYEADHQDHILAVLIEGKFSSLYQQAPEMAADNEIPYMFYSAKPAQILVVGDSDILRDDVWLEGEMLNDNGQFLWRAVDILNGHEEQSVLYKTQLQSMQKSLGEQLYEKTAGEYQEKANQKISELNEIRQEYDNLQNLINSGQQSMDAHLAMKINKMRDEVGEIEQTLQQYDYNIQKSFAYKKQIIIWANLLLIPLLLILLWLGGYQMYIRKRRKQVKEKYDAN